MYFDDFNSLAYDFKTGLDDSKELVFVKDITQNIRFRKEFLNSLSLYNAYTIKDGETPENISQKVYGTPLYHWVIMLVNDRYDHINDFPLDTNKLGIMIQNKYGDRKEDVHHFVDVNNKLTPGYQIISIPNYYLPETNNNLYDVLRVGMLLKRPVTMRGVSDMYTGIIENIDTQTESITVLLLNGNFRIRDPIDIVKYIEDSSGNIVEDSVINVNVLVDSSDEDSSKWIYEYTIKELSYLFNSNPITNQEYEYLLNDSKRNIRIVPKAYLDQIMTEFSSLMK
jgi:hypothetical protein